MTISLRKHQGEDCKLLILCGTVVSDRFYSGVHYIIGKITRVR